jgi:hypothetical protein
LRGKVFNDKCEKSMAGYFCSFLSRQTRRDSREENKGKGKMRRRTKMLNADGTGYAERFTPNLNPRSCDLCEERNWWLVSPVT